MNPPGKTIGCKKHPRYRGILKPRVPKETPGCTCWDEWRLISETGVRAR